jgi:hypothetical protein
MNIMNRENSSENRPFRSNFIHTVPTQTQTTFRSERRGMVADLEGTAGGSKYSTPQQDKEKKNADASRIVPGVVLVASISISVLSAL